MLYFLSAAGRTFQQGSSRPTRKDLKISALGASLPGVGVDEDERGCGTMLLCTELPPMAVEAEDKVDSYLVIRLLVDFPEFGGSLGGVGVGTVRGMPSSAPS